MAVASPCTGACQLDGDGVLCLGCHRTLAEIQLWPEATEDARRAILRQVAGRRYRAQ